MTFQDILNMPTSTTKERDLFRRAATRWYDERIVGSAVPGFADVGEATKALAQKWGAMHEASKDSRE